MDVQKKPSWWKLKYVLCSPRKLGKIFQFDEHIFQRGWMKPPTRKRWPGRIFFVDFCVAQDVDGDHRNHQPSTGRHTDWDKDFRKRLFGPYKIYINLYFRGCHVMVTMVSRILFHVVLLKCIYIYIHICHVFNNPSTPTKNTANSGWHMYSCTPSMNFKIDTY